MGSSYSKHATARILDRKLGYSTWDDVLKVIYQGLIFHIGDVVDILGVGVGTITAFRPRWVKVSPFTDSYEYEFIRVVSGGKLDPNQAFASKKRRMF